MVEVKIKDDMKRVEKAADKGIFRNIFHALASISKDAKASIKSAVGPSAVGSPPHTRRGLIRRAIRYATDVNKKGGAVGVQRSIAGKAGKPHEFGGDYKGTHFEERPFMAPALKRAIPRFAGSFTGSIGE